MRRAEGALPLHQAVALGLLQGPTELLPVSSSAHTTLLPWFADWSYGELDADLRKSFEVALHAGAGVALVLAMRKELRAGALAGGRCAPRAPSTAAHGGAAAVARTTAAMALALLPPAAAGFALHDEIEQRLGRPRSIAFGLFAGALAMALADRRAAGGRRCAEAGPLDGLALGLAQAAALVPGVSRSGATLSAARMRGFERAAAWALSWAVALPVFAGASLLQAVRIARAPADGGLGYPLKGHGRAFAAGAAGAFMSTLASAAAVRRLRVAESGLAPFAAYRGALALAVLLRDRLCPSRVTARG
jgi:undecaprenyl-diphosphatase